MFSQMGACNICYRHSSADEKNPETICQCAGHVVSRQGWCATECSNTHLIAQRSVTWCMYEGRVQLGGTHRNTRNPHYMSQGSQMSL